MGCLCILAHTFGIGLLLLIVQLPRPEPFATQELSHSFRKSQEVPGKVKKRQEESGSIKKSSGSIMKHNKKSRSLCLGSCTPLLDKDCFVYIAAAPFTKPPPCDALLLASKPSIQVDNVFLTVLVTSLGPRPKSSTPCQHTFPCCTVCFVWLALWAREISLCMIRDT